MTDQITPKIKLAVWLTYIGLWSERILQAFWPLLSIVFLSLGISFLGRTDLWPIEFIFAVTCFGFVALLGSLWYVRIWFLYPTLDQAFARLDQSLPSRPLAALQDLQATGKDDVGSKELWNEHLSNMLAKAKEAKSPSLDFKLASQDPFALRHISFLILLLGIIFGNFYTLRNLEQSQITTAISGLIWEGWLQPPSYTGRPMVYLNDVIGKSLSVSQDSILIFRFYGDPGAFIVNETISSGAEKLNQALDEDQRLTIGQSGQVNLRGPVDITWTFDVIKDQQPKVDILNDVNVDGLGQFTQSFNASDDFGVTAGMATVSLNLAKVDRRHGLETEPDIQLDIELPLPLTISGDRSNFSESLVENLSKHVWAHLPVFLVFQVSDIRRQTGKSALREIILPARQFFDPLANALIEQRRDILWSKKNIRRATQILRAISTKPIEIFRDLDDAASLKEIITQLEATDINHVTDKNIETIAELLWELSIEVEDGDLDQAIKKLARAQEKLEEAIKNGANPDEISRLIDELRDAQNDYISEFSERNQARGERSDGSRQTEKAVTQGELQKMMDKLQELMEDGRMAEAQELLEEINRLMQNLQSVRSQPGQNGGENRNGSQQSMKDLTETLRQQQQLSDQTFRDFQDRKRNKSSEDDQRNDKLFSDNDNLSELEKKNNQSLAEQQRNLQKELERQRGNLLGNGAVTDLPARRALDNARRIMDQAVENLERGNLPNAIDNQSKVIDALRDGMQKLKEAQTTEPMQGQGVTPNDQRTGEGSQNNSNLDPLGRDLGASGQLGAGEQMLPEEEQRLRSQALMDEIRKRSGGLERPSEERQYLKRLLDKFQD